MHVAVYKGTAENALEDGLATRFTGLLVATLWRRRPSLAGDTDTKRKGLELWP